MAEAVVGHQLDERRVALVVTRVQPVRRRRRIDLLAVAAAVANEEPQGFAGECGHGLTVQTVVRAAPGAEHIAARSDAANDVCGIRCANGNDAADRRAAVQGRSRAVQDLDALDQAGVDEVAGRIRKAARVELVGQRHAVHEDRDTIAADAADVDALGAEARAGCLVVDTRHIAKDVTDRGSQLGIEVGAGQHRHARGDFADRPLILVRNDDNLLDPGGIGVVGRRNGGRQDQGQPRGRCKRNKISGHRASGLSG